MLWGGRKSLEQLRQQPSAKIRFSGDVLVGTLPSPAPPSRKLKSLRRRPPQQSDSLNRGNPDFKFKFWRLEGLGFEFWRRSGSVRLQLGRVGFTPGRGLNHPGRPAIYRSRAEGHCAWLGIVGSFSCVGLALWPSGSSPLRYKAVLPAPTAHP